MPKWRTEKYAIWYACERFHLLPPNVQPGWDDNNVLIQAELLAYSQIRMNEEGEQLQSHLDLSL